MYLRNSNLVINVVPPNTQLRYILIGIIKLNQGSLYGRSSCASGLGVCCVLTAGCDTGASSLEVASPSPSPSPLQVHNNLTYLTLDTVEGSTSCTWRVCPSTEEVLPAPPPGAGVLPEAGPGAVHPGGAGGRRLRGRGGRGGEEPALHRRTGHRPPVTSALCAIQSSHSIRELWILSPTVVCGRRAGSGGCRVGCVKYAKTKF